MLFESSIVRIDSGSNVYGTGFVISDGLVLTCAHVVCDEKGSLRPALRIVFHHWPSESAREVSVEERWWRDPEGEDIAVLRFEPPAPPA
jgi:V8-like Glu-specific endopeptidase